MGKARLIQEEGKGRKANASKRLNNSEKANLWEQGKLGKANLGSLLHTVWFNNIQQRSIIACWYEDE